jgi:LmbE family N-acetylglucosaminyl deacetylase
VKDLVLNSSVVLAIGAHPDDIELGCGGTIKAVTNAGHRVIAVYLTKGEVSGDPVTRMSESNKALAVLGVNEIIFGDFNDTEIPNNHQGVKFLEKIYDKYNPSTVLTHTTHDTHQDHRQVGWLSLSAFRNVQRLLAYESPRSTGEFSPNYFVDITGSVDCKWKSLQCHMTQKAKRYLAYESMVNLASYRGSQVNLRSAEAFEVIRFVEKPLF